MYTHEVNVINIAIQVFLSADSFKNIAPNIAESIGANAIITKVLATVADGDSTIVFEFHAPWPVDPPLDYQQWAMHALLHAHGATTAAAGRPAQLPRPQVPSSAVILTAKPGHWRAA